MTQNIQKEVLRYIDNNIAIRRNLKEGLINIRALARKILADTQLNCSTVGIVSAIRRYEDRIETVNYLPLINKMLSKAKLASKTKLASILIKKNANTRNKLAQLFPLIDFESGDTLRIFEVSKYIKIIIDEEILPEVSKIFGHGEMLLKEKNIGELAIIYGEDITSVPGLFATVANELAVNNISIVDSMICYNEHIIIVHAADMKKTFDTIFNLLGK